MMLKTTFADGRVLFEDLGDKFILISEQRCPNDFKAVSDQYFKEVSDMAKDCYAFISSLRTGVEDVPIFKEHYYSVIGERGLDVLKITIGGL